MFVKYRNVDRSDLVAFLKKMMLNVLQGFLKKMLVKRNLCYTFILPQYTGNLFL